MKSYLDLLTSSITENAEGTGGNVMAVIAKALDCDQSEAAERLSKLSLDDQIKVTDAASQGDTAEILLKLGEKKIEEDALTQLPKGSTIPANADIENPDGTITPGGKQTGRPDFVDPKDAEAQAQGQQMPGQPMPPQGGSPRPVQAPGNQPQIAGAKAPTGPAPKVSGTVTRPSGTQGTGPRQQPIAESDFQPGDEVIVRGKEAVVSGVDDGPHGSKTIGVMIDDGQVEMVKKKEVSMKKIDEHVLGVARMPGLSRMLELAGVRKDPVDQDEDEKKNVEAEAEPAKKPWEKEEAKPAETAEQPAEQTAEQPEQPQAEAPAVTIQVHDMQTGATHKIADQSTTTEEPECEEECDPREEIMTALQTIEQHLPNIRLGDFKEVRRRLETIQNAVLESALNRRRKL